IESLHADPAHALAAELRYCARDRATEPFVARLEKLCAALPRVRLNVYGAQQGALLEPGSLAASLHDASAAEVWFCGPRGLADALPGALARLGSRPRVHQEAVEMR